MEPKSGEAGAASRPVGRPGSEGGGYQDVALRPDPNTSSGWPDLVLVHSDL